MKNEVLSEQSFKGVRVCGWCDLCNECVYGGS